MYGVEQKVSRNVVSMMVVKNFIAMKCVFSHRRNHAQSARASAPASSTAGNTQKPLCSVQLQRRYRGPRAAPNEESGLQRYSTVLRTSRWSACRRRASSGAIFRPSWPAMGIAQGGSERRTSTFNGFFA